MSRSYASGPDRGDPGFQVAQLESLQHRLPLERHRRAVLTVQVTLDRLLAPEQAHASRSNSSWTSPVARLLS
jgi:hypothetical protein